MMVCSGSLEFCKAISTRMKNSNGEGSQRCHRKQKKKKRVIMYSVCYTCKRKKENNASLYVFCLHKEILTNTQDPKTSCTQGPGRRWMKKDGFLLYHILYFQICECVNFWKKIKVSRKNIPIFWSLGGRSINLFTS